MNKNDTLDRWLDRHNPVTFTSVELAESLGVARSEASRLIAMHVLKQQQPRVKPRHVISRIGRTAAAVWYVGAGEADAQLTERQYADDVEFKNRVASVHTAAVASANPRPVLERPIAQSALDLAVEWGWLSGAQARALSAVARAEL